jgi:hypothetical protein
MLLELGPPEIAGFTALLNRFVCRVSETYKRKRGGLRAGKPANPRRSPLDLAHATTIPHRQMTRKSAETRV